MSDQTPFRGTVNLQDLGGFELKITYNGLIAVRHIPCGALMILDVNGGDLPSVVQGAMDHTCSVTVPEIPDYTAPKTSYTDQELLDLGLLHWSADGILTGGPVPQDQPELCKLAWPNFCGLGPGHDGLCHSNRISGRTIQAPPIRYVPSAAAVELHDALGIPLPESNRG